MNSLNQEQEAILTELFDNFPVTTVLSKKDEAENYSKKSKSDLIGSICIESLLVKREKAIVKLHQALKLLSEASELSADIGAGGLCINDLKHAAYSQYGELHIVKNIKSNCTVNPIKKIESKMIKRWDMKIWNHLLEKTNMITVMDSKAKDEWYDQLDKGTFPEVNRNNIESTFSNLNADKLHMFERGIVNVFKSLSWCYKTNLPVRFGDKIILNGIFNCDSLGIRLFYHSRAKLTDLERIFKIMDGESIPERGQDLPCKIDDSISSCLPHHSDKYFLIKYFKNGNAHVKFKRPDLVNLINDTIAKHYGRSLPPAR